MCIRRINAMLLCCVAASALAVGNLQADWPSWRGPESTGSTNVGTYPLRLDEQSLLWRAELPGKGCSTPIVSNKTVYVTAPINGKDALLAMDWSGRQQWGTVFGTETAGKHRNGSGCNASPATDGDAVFVYYKSGTLAAVNLDGTVRWQTDLVERFGPDERFWDHGTSPVLTKRHVVMARMHAGDSWLAAFDKETGDMAWKVPRNYPSPQEGDQCYTTPLVVQYDGKEALLVWGAQHVTIHAAASGKVIWSCGNFNPDSIRLWPAIASPVILGDMAVICHGRNDRGDPRLHGIRLAGNGDVTATSHIWQRDDIGSFVPTPAVFGQRVYLLRDRGEVECIDPDTGKTVWSDALPKGRSNYYASPLIAAGNLYAAREDGTVFVASIADNQFKLVSENELGEPVIGSPVPAANRILIRGQEHLFCFGAR